MDKKRAVIFDLDGTLVDSIEDLGLSVHYALGSLGYDSSRDPKVYAPMVGNGTKKLVERAMKQFHVPDELFPDIFSAFQSIYEKCALEHTVAYPGITELLQNLKVHGVLMAVHTNKPDSIAKKIVGHLFPDIFCGVFGQKEGIPLKPAPDVSLQIARQFGLSVAEVAFCGDSNVDIYTAQNAGMFSIGVLWGFRDETELKSAGAQAIVRVPDEIKKYILTLDKT